MDEQHGVHIEVDALGLTFPAYPHELAGRSGDRVAHGGEEESRIEGNGQAFRLSCPIDDLWCR
jgi:hypothetical protein